MTNENSAIVLLYDPTNGTILHGLSYEIDNDGGELPDRDSLERSAREHGERELARREVPTPVDSLAALHVDPVDFDFRRTYRVDPESRTLIEIE
jgi:hypothetical protein